jgi:hypothetical protein
MSKSETEQQERKVVEYWAKTKTRRLYDDIGLIDFKNDNDIGLPFEPTAVLAKAPPNLPATKRFSIFDLT